MTKNLSKSHPKPVSKSSSIASPSLLTPTTPSELSFRLNEPAIHPNEAIEMANTQGVPGGIGITEEPLIYLEDEPIAQLILRRARNKYNTIAVSRMPARSSVPKKSDITACDGHKLHPLDQFVDGRAFTGILFFSLGMLLATFVELLCGGGKVRVVMPKSATGPSFSEKLGAFWWAWKSDRVLGLFL